MLCVSPARVPRLAAHVRRPRLDYESHAVALDRNELGALLVAAGLVIWFNQAHKTFYGIAGIVLGIVSFPASNLGGLFVGMLLAIIGGSIAFAWTPIQPATDPVAGTAASPDAGEAALS